MHQQKRLLSLLLTAFFLTTLLAFAGGNVFAASAIVSTEDQLITALGDSSIDSITVNGTINVHSEQTVGRKVTIKGNGTINLSDYYLTVGSSGHLTLTDNVTVAGTSTPIGIEGGYLGLIGNATVKSSESTAIIVTNSEEKAGFVTIMNGTVKGGDVGIAAFSSNVTITGGTVSGPSSGLVLFENSSALVTGGTIYCSGSDYFSGGIVSEASNIRIEDSANISGSKSIFDIYGSNITIENNNNLKLTGQISSLDSNGNIIKLLGKLPNPISMQAGKNYSFTLDTAASVYNTEYTSDELKAVMSDNKVSLSPTKSGNYNITFNIKNEIGEAGNGTIIIINIPVKVTAASSSIGSTSSNTNNNTTGNSSSSSNTSSTNSSSNTSSTSSHSNTSSSTSSRTHAANPDTGAFSVYPYLFGFLAVIFVTAGSMLGYKHHKQSK